MKCTVLWKVLGLNDEFINNIWIPILQMTKARLKVTEENQRALKWEHEVLEQRFEKVKTFILHCKFVYFVRIFFWPDEA